MGKKNSIGKTDNQLILPILTLENIVLTPVIPQPVKIENEEQKEYLDKCAVNGSEIFVATTRPSESKPGEEQILNCGLIAIVDRMLQMPGAPTLVFLRPATRAVFQGMVFNPAYPMAKLTPIPNIPEPKRISTEIKLTLERIENLFKEMTQFMGEPEKLSATKLIQECSATPLAHLYALTHVAPISTKEKYQILETMTYPELVEKVAIIFDEAIQRINIQAYIHEKTHRELSQQQKEAFLRQHLKQVREELGETEDFQDVAELIERSLDKKWDDETQKHFNKEIQRLKRLNVNNPEYSVQYDYLEAMLNLPWNNYKNKKISLEKVKKILDRDHFGLEKVKERILEYMAVITLRKDLKAPILCLYGPPGVGKTSIGKSIAEATGRDYARIALGGIHDEAEIRGHRRTYIGSMPGRILHTLSKLKYGNPLILLDEIDKLGKDYKGDPSSALLEALDPEQNNTFHDNFIDHPYDLSKVLFIATANDLSTIPAPLRDRMEIIEMTGYIPEEKREIAGKHLVNKVLVDNGFDKNEVKFQPEAIDTIIRFYTREAGVRQLEKKISKIVRKLGVLKASGKKFSKTITPELVFEMLGKKEFLPDSYEDNNFAGVATGLAWTPSGGDILFIESSLAPGKGEKITLTGNLGDVMKESAVIAMQYLKANSEKLGINPKLFSHYDVHIHVPEGAVPKDGPSAGITIASSIASAFSGKKMRERTAMTGEITLRGKVLPVGGLKEKIIAARQGGINCIILSEDNRKDIEVIPSKYIEGMDFVYVKTLPEVFDAAILDEDAPKRFNLSC